MSNVYTLCIFEGREDEASFGADVLKNCTQKFVTDNESISDGQSAEGFYSWLFTSFPV